MRSICASLLAAFLLASCEGRPDWISDLLSGVNAQVDRINMDVNEQVARINQDVQAQLDRTNKQIQADIARAQEEARNTGSGGSSVIRQGNTVIINSSGGYTHTVNSGVDEAGHRYSIEIEDRVKDGVVTHTERVYNATTNQYETYVSERKLSDPQPYFSNFTTTTTTTTTTAAP